MKQYNHRAIRNLYPDAKIVKYSNETKEFKVYDENEKLITIDYKQVEVEDNRIKSEYKKNQYQRDRSISYPSIQDQLDMLYWDRKNGTKTWEESIDKVKADNPKPE
tara:strand:+ start:494 stop:811 length:318 start_codon:yes stop_codon:yes gene_type:complete